MFVNARTYVLGFNKRYVIRTYVAYVWEQNWQHQTDRQTDTERDKDTERERERETIKHRGLYRTFFLLIGAVWKKQDHSLESSILVQVENIVLSLI